MAGAALQGNFGETVRRAVAAQVKWLQAETNRAFDDLQAAIVEGRGDRDFINDTRHELAAIAERALHISNGIETFRP